VVGRASPGPSALHPDERFVAEPRRALVGLITSQAIRRGTFDAVRERERAIMAWLAAWN